MHDVVGCLSWLLYPPRPGLDVVTIFSHILVTLSFCLSYVQASAIVVLRSVLSTDRRLVAFNMCYLLVWVVVLGLLALHALRPGIIPWARLMGAEFRHRRFHASQLRADRLARHLRCPTDSTRRRCERFLAARGDQVAPLLHGNRAQRRQLAFGHRRACSPQLLRAWVMAPERSSTWVMSSIRSITSAIWFLLRLPVHEIVHGFLLVARTALLRASLLYAVTNRLVVSSRTPEQPLWTRHCDLPPLPGRIGGSGEVSGRPLASSRPESISSDSDDDVAAFVSSEWLGRGLVWHSGLPPYVRAARNLARCIPSRALHFFIPSSNTSVAEVLADSTRFPALERSCAPPVYTMHPPNVLTCPPASDRYRDELHALRALLFASLSHDTLLRSTFDDAWLSGVGSITFASHPEVHYPLWVEHLLGEVSIVVPKYHRWTYAVQWLSAVEDMHADDRTLALVEGCREVLDAIPWIATAPNPSPAVQLTTVHLATLLSHTWANDEQLNAGADWIMRHGVPRDSRMRIANSNLLGALRLARARSEVYVYRPSSSLDRAIRNGSVDTLEIIVHTHEETHWAAITLDLHDFTFTYRDGKYLRDTAAPDDLQLLLWYLQSLNPRYAGKTFRPASVMHHSPRQHDSHSCGINLLSTILHDHTEETYYGWSQEFYAAARLEWFLRLADDFMLADHDSDDSDGSDSSDSSRSEDGDDDGHDGDDELVVVEHPIMDPSDFDGDDAHSNLDDGDKDDDFVMVDAPSEVNPCQQTRSVSRTTDTRSIGLDEVASLLEFGAQAVRSSPSRATSTTSSCTRTVPAPAKRPFLPSAEGSCSDSDTDSDSRGARRARPRGATSSQRVRTGRSSWVYQKELSAKSKEADFIASKARLASFRDKIRLDDKLALFKDDDLMSVRCSACAKWVKMRVLFDVRRWKEHRQSPACQGRCATGLRSTSLKSYFSPTSKTQPPSPSLVRPSDVHTRPATITPCPGLLRTSSKLIERYLARSSVDGGGAPSRSRIARELFYVEDGEDNLTWSSLTQHERAMVLRRESVLFKWRNNRTVGAVFSTSCAGVASSSFPLRPCEDCHALWRLHGFQVIVNRKMPAEGTWKFTPKAYRNGELGSIYLKYKGNDGANPWLRFAQNASAGLYKSHEVVLGLVKAMVEKADRVRLGKRHTNMHYTEALDSFCNVLQSISPRAYKTFRHVFAGRTPSSMSQQRAKQPRFAAGFSAANVQRVVETLQRLSYNGPLALAWDDTDLEKALSVWQSSKDAWTIIGAVQGSVVVKSVQDVDAFFADQQIERASKLRIWTLSIPLPKVPPILVCALAHGSRDTSESLLSMHERICALLHAVNIHPVSAAADGAETERKLQRLISASAHSVLQFTIGNGLAIGAASFSIPCFYGLPCVLVQDSKHALKTARNQLLSGARVLVMGNFPILTAMLDDFADHPDGPLLHRDVYRVDRQDDRAAGRLFSSDALAFHLRHHPEQPALSVYLFVCGELVDAWQNRCIGHVARVRMVLRARLVLTSWRTHVDRHPDHNLATHFISRESYDILIILCHRLVELIVAYRCFYATYPLLPWLHSTEVCEHIFGVLRQIKPDFTYADMLYMEPKLRALLMGAFESLSSQEAANEVAEGYHHTYFQTDDIDLCALMQWPTDEQLDLAASDAFDDAAQLLSAVGLDIVQLVPHNNNASSHLTQPAIAMQLPTPLAPPPVPYSPPSNAAGPTNESFMTELLRLLNVTDVPSVVEDELDVYSAALAADDVGKTLTIISLPDSSPDEEVILKGAIEEACAEAADPPVDADVSSSRHTTPLVDSTSLSIVRSEMVSRRAQTQSLGFTALRRRGGRASTNEERRMANELRTTRASIVDRVSELMDKHEKTTTAGVNRRVRHAGTYAATNVEPSSRRQERKRASQKVSADAFMRHRNQAFRPLQHFHEQMISGNVNDLWPLCVDGFILALHFAPGTNVPQIAFGQVISMHTNSGARGATYEPIHSTSSIGYPSAIAMLLFAPSHGRSFSSAACQSLDCATVLRLDRAHVLFSLANSHAFRKQDISENGAHPVTLVTVDDATANLISVLQQHIGAVEQAVAALCFALKPPKSS
ncbi:unnamed protein product [Peniophora sp. CBMAI 1063]|nr:unnamed protein product [Peniophora sp. CBMAI 1063]